MNKTDERCPKGAAKFSVQWETRLQCAFEFSEVKIMNPYSKRKIHKPCRSLLQNSVWTCLKDNPPHDQNDKFLQKWRREWDNKNKWINKVKFWIWICIVDWLWFYESIFYLLFKTWKHFFKKWIQIKIFTIFQKIYKNMSSQINKSVLVPHT